MEYLPQGYILKNGVKPLHGFKYDHPLDGHGFINRIKVSPHGFEYKGIRQKTYHYKKEKKSMLPSSLPRSHREVPGPRAAC